MGLGTRLHVYIFFAEVDGIGGGPTLLITPESMLLSHGGSIQILPGIPRSTSNFSAPELNQPENCRESIDIEKVKFEI